VRNRFELLFLHIKSCYSFIFVCVCVCVAVVVEEGARQS